uniref:Acyltransferase 3 domain-containing protein n=1 Tax=Globisporangium ultimum (strain ATCC 200006 / CBS 805.95 / DAOM BR144) TaxID=431595 RepID=K3WMB6_GLOUD
MARRGRTSSSSVSTDDHDTVLSVQEVSDAAPAELKEHGAQIAAKDARPKSGGPAKILFLDGVRGVAAILVVTQHSGYMGDVNLGICAVDIFFVLSSFLLTWLFYKKSAQLLAQQASLRKWSFYFADYFSKRFLRVYPLFAVTAIVVWIMPFEYKKKYFLNKNSKPDDYDLLKVLTFDFPSRYHVFWTLPLEIAYYFFIPVFVVLVIRLGRAWWMPFIPLYMWIVNNGLNVFRGDHQPLVPHLPTFVSGSMAAVIYIKLDDAIKRNSFEFSKWQRRGVHAVQYLVFALLLSVCYRGLLFDWVHANPFHENHGARFISLHVTVLIVVEMLLPSSISTIFEWSVLRYWGKISFSVYLLHSFVIYTDSVHNQPNYYDKLFGQFGLIFLLATASYHLIEYPSQLMAQRISKVLAQREGSTPAPAAKYLPVPTGVSAA